VIQRIRLSAAVAHCSKGVEASAGVLEGCVVMTHAATYQAEFELHARLTLAITCFLAGATGQFVNAGGILPVRRAF
jgi:hypothetical protein